MKKRSIWLDRMAHEWRQRPIVWLSGVRRTGKTTLIQSLPGHTLLLDCDDPAVEARVEDPMRFFASVKADTVAFDEIHRLKDPARLLKIGADRFPKLRILATGSSTLWATRKFSDALTDRKRTVHLPPVLWSELTLFDASIEKRLYRGGLPGPLLQEGEGKDRAFYREWLDSFFARDVQRLFAFRDFEKFNSVFEYVLRTSGGQFEITKAASTLGLSRATVDAHLGALRIMLAATLVRPFHGGGVKELTKMPKVYAFDTGFVSFARAWSPLRPSDYGVLWEHVVLEQLQGLRPEAGVQYWRDASGHEIDFVIAGNRGAVDAIECKWRVDEFESKTLRLFRSYYPRGRNFLIVPRSGEPYTKAYGDLEVTVASPSIWAPAEPRSRPRTPRAGS
jgi:hypothetical protein